MSSDATLGWHWMATAQDCAIASIGSPGAIEKVLVAMVAGLELRAVAPPVVRPTDHGVAGVILLAESHLAIHTTVARGEAMVDLFSCAPFDHERAEALLQQHLQSGAIHAELMVRGAS